MLSNAEGTDSLILLDGGATFVIKGPVDWERRSRTDNLRSVCGWARLARLREGWKPKL